MEILIRNKQGREVWVPKDVYESKKDRNEWERVSHEKPEQEPNAPEQESDISSLSWGELRTRASKKGVYEVGMTKKDVIEALEDVGTN